jgi:hypothetical protein
LFIRNCAPKSPDFEEKNLKITISCTLSYPSTSIKRRKLCRLHYIDRQTNTPFMILYILRCDISVVLESNTHKKPPLSSQMHYYNLGIVSCIKHCPTIAHILWMHSFSPEKFTCSKASSGIWGCYDLSFQTVRVPYHVFFQISTKS